MRVHILIGLPGAGKTTYREQNFGNTDVAWVVSKDLMGRNAPGKELRQQTEVQSLLDRGHNIVLDNTNCGAYRREDTIRRAKAAGAEVFGYYFDSTAEECAKRNQKRTGYACVPDHVITRFEKELNKPTLAEGFDRIYIIKTLPNHQFSTTEIV